jgi:hypothetical protein
MKKQPIYGDYTNRDAQGQAVPIDYGPMLGFLQPWNPKKPDDKKHETQRDWAYNQHIINFKCEERNGHLWISGYRNTWDNNVCVEVDVGEWADPQPMVYSNTPLPGFKVQHAISRYSTSNKLWRILDPRGFELEITTGCMETLIQNATIIKGGMIDAKCVWVGNKNLIVVP